MRSVIQGKCTSKKIEQLDRALEQLVLDERRYIDKKVNQLKQLSFYLEKNHPSQKIILNENGNLKRCKSSCNVTCNITIKRKSSYL